MDELGLSDPCMSLLTKSNEVIISLAQGTEISKSHKAKL